MLRATQKKTSCLSIVIYLYLLIALFIWAANASESWKQSFETDIRNSPSIQFFGTVFRTTHSSQTIEAVILERDWKQQQRAGLHVVGDSSPALRMLVLNDGFGGLARDSTIYSIMAPRWHQGTVAPRALKKN